MTGKQEKIIQTQHMPSGWFLRWATYGVASVSYLFGLFLVQRTEELSVIRERNRIAREIHDTLGHSLTLLAVQLETATQHEMRGDPRLHEELLEARQVAKACLTEVRHSVEALRPDEASADSLQEQLRSLVAQFATTCREARITLDLEEATQPLYPELGLALYRCAREALTNIRKHAHATKVLLRLSTTCGEAQQVELTVLDNGRVACLSTSIERLASASWACASASRSWMGHCGLALNPGTAGASKWCSRSKNGGKRRSTPRE